MSLYENPMRIDGNVDPDVDFDIGRIDAPTPDRQIQPDAVFGRFTYSLMKQEMKIFGRIAKIDAIAVKAVNKFIDVADKRHIWKIF
jgi:hypothetical protein